MPPIGLPPNLSEDPMNQAILARVFAEMALAGVVELVRSSTDMMLPQRAVDAMDTVSTILGPLDAELRQRPGEDGIHSELAGSDHLDEPGARLMIGR